MFFSFAKIMISLKVCSQGRIFWKIWLPSFTQKPGILRKIGENHKLDLKMTETLWGSGGSLKQSPYLDSASLKTPITTLCLTMWWIWVLQVVIFRYHSILHEGQMLSSCHLAVVIIALAFNMQITTSQDIKRQLLIVLCHTIQKKHKPIPEKLCVGPGLSV